MSSRREFMKGVLAGGGAVLLSEYANAGAIRLTRISAGLTRDEDAWLQVPGILRRIKPPVFPKRTFEITRFGAVADGTTDCTPAIADAMAAADGEPERDDHCDKQCGADQRRIRHGGPLAIPLLRRRHRADAETNHVDAAALVVQLRQQFAELEPLLGA